MRPQLALVGCGKMGQALLSGWLSSDLACDIIVIQPDPLPYDCPKSGFVYQAAPLPGQTFDQIVFAVKPQVLNNVISAYTEHMHEQTLIISIAAGKQISVFEDAFSTAQPVIRAMPNTPASIGQGVTALTANMAVTQVQKDGAFNLFATTGHVLWIDAESEMDAVTAISGSGPAYLFYFIEIFTKAAQELGFSEETATLLARQTILGASALAAENSAIDAATLRQNVTSPGGTTAAALHVLMDGRWQDLLNEAVHAAESRGKELNA